MKRVVHLLFISCFFFLFPWTVAAQETVCIQCHSGQQGRLAEPVSRWKGSIHDLNGIECFHCHGGDPADFAMAMSPERGFVGAPSEAEVPEFCGRCHVGVKDDYLASAHGKALGSGGPNCVTCHGSHAIQQASPDLINAEDCSRCHEYGRAEEIKAAIGDTEGIITRLQTALAAMHRIGIDTSQMEGQLFAIRNEFRRLFHSVDVQKVRSETAGFQERLAKISDQVEALEAELVQRKMWGGGVVALLLLAGVLGLLLHKTYMKEDQGL